MRTPLLPLVLLAVTPVAVAAAPLHGECPLPDAERGYPLAVSWGEGDAQDTTFLAEFARAAAHRWQVPSRRRAQYAGWQRVRTRQLPPEPRWADDWTPGEKHRAVLAVTLYRDGRSPGASVVTGSGDKLFDRSLESMVRDPMPGAPPLPPYPATAADSVRVLVHLGERPPSPSASVAFARQQRPVRLVPGTLRVDAPRSGIRPRATVKYDVAADGQLAPGSLEIVESSEPEFARSVTEALGRARFTPAESNCRPITMTVVQTFGS